MCADAFYLLDLGFPVREHAWIYLSYRRCGGFGTCSLLSLRVKTCCRHAAGQSALFSASQTIFKPILLHSDSHTPSPLLLSELHRLLLRSTILQLRDFPPHHTPTLLTLPTVLLIPLLLQLIHKLMVKRARPRRSTHTPRSTRSPRRPRSFHTTRACHNTVRTSNSADRPTTSSTTQWLPHWTALHTCDDAGI